MISINEIVNTLPPMKDGKDLMSDLSVLPEYNGNIRFENAAVRLIALSDLYRLYLPSPMSVEIYSKLYLALLRSLQKKATKAAVQQQNENFKAVRQQECSGILGGSDSFTIIGASGIGKSTAISRAVDLIASNGVIEINAPYSKIIPCVIVQCPFDSSVKGLLLEILRKVDECLQSKYYQNALRARATTDMLIGSVSQVALNHIGLLVVDEIQNVVNSKNGKSLVGMLTQLINNSGISICMVGTPESAVFFEQAMQLARRSLGLQYHALDYNAYFYSFCHTLFSYQYTRNPSHITDNIIEWLYEHSAGIVSVVVSLVHDAQEIAILTGEEMLNLTTLREAYKKRLTLLHGYITPANKPIKLSNARNNNPSVFGDMIQANPIDDVFSITDLATIAKTHNKEIISLLKEHISVTEVQL